MRILMVTSSMDAGGAETHVCELSHALSEIGHEVCVASSGGRLARALEAEGIPHIFLPLNKKTPRSVFISKRGLRRAIKDFNPHIVHAHTRISAFAASKICEGENVGLVCTVHGHFKTGYLLNALSRWGDRAIAVSYDLRRHLLLNCGSILADNVTVISNGIDTERFSPAIVDKRSKGRRRITFMSRLDEDCSAGAYALCRIALTLCKKYGDVEIVIAGGGSEYESIRRLVGDINRTLCRDAVRVVGHVTDTPALFRDSDIFIGVSRAALEAMSCGISVILAGNEGYGGILEPCNLLKLSYANFCARGEERLSDEVLLRDVERLLGMTAEERRSLGEGLRAFVLENHSLRQTAKATLSVYESAKRNAVTDKKGVLLCGYYGYGNLGDERLLCEAVKRAKRDFPSSPVIALTRKGKRDGVRYGIRCLKRIEPLSVVRGILASHTVVFGGGTLLQNGTSRRSLWYYLAILWTAKRLGKRTELWGNGIGRVDGRYCRKITAKVLSESDLIGLRDKPSLSRLSTLFEEWDCISPKTVLEKDLAASPLAGGENSELLLRRLGISLGERIAAVAIKGSESVECINAMTEWLKSLNLEGIKLVFLIMYPDEDMEISRKICEELGGIVAYPLGAAEMQELMRKCCLVCSMRYHALIFATLAGVPFIGFGDEEKVADLCRFGGGRYYVDLPQCQLPTDSKYYNGEKYGRTKRI